MRGTRGWQESGHASKTLVKHSDLRVVLIALKAGASLGEHRTGSRISIRALEGRVRLKLPSEVVELPAGTLLALGPSQSRRAAPEHERSLREDAILCANERLDSADRSRLHQGHLLR